MKVLLFLIFQVTGLSTCLAENLLWTYPHTPPLPNLEVRWEATNRLPQQVWVYQMLPNRFSPTVISNAMALCGFTEKDRIESNQEGMTFQNTNGTRTLSVSYAAAKIDYDPPDLRFTIKLVPGVPTVNELPGLITSRLKLLDIPPSETTEFHKGERFILLVSGIISYEESGAVTNFPDRQVRIGRSLDGLHIKEDEGIELTFGEYGKLNRLTLIWHKLKREKPYPVSSLLAIQEYLKQGQAHPCLLPMDVEPIDWTTVKRITVKEARPYYHSGDTDKLYPYLNLVVIVDTGQRQVNTQVNCPIFDESQL